MWSKPFLYRFRQSKKIQQTQVSQGFAGFRLAMSRIPPRHSQSRRATNCATPGYGAPYAFLAVGFTIITQNWEVRKSILPQNYLLNLKCWVNFAVIIGESAKVHQLKQRFEACKKVTGLFCTLKRRHTVCRRFSYSSSLANPPRMLSFISPVRALL